MARGQRPGIRWVATLAVAALVVVTAAAPPPRPDARPDPASVRRVAVAAVPPGVPGDPAGRRWR